MRLSGGHDGRGLTICSSTRPCGGSFSARTQTEFGHASEAFTRIALAAPQVHFTLRHNDRPVFELSAADGLLERIARFFGRELAESLIWVESSDGPVRISGYVAHPSQSRSNNRMQYFFLNGRHIRDHALQHALGEAYRGLLMTGRCPIAFLSLEMPPEMVDVNVHPTKLEVRFQDSGRLYSQLLATLRRKFLTSDLTTPRPRDGPHEDSDRRARRGAGRPVAAATGRLGQGEDRRVAARRPAEAAGARPRGPDSFVRQALSGGRPVGVAVAASRLAVARQSGPAGEHSHAGRAGATSLPPGRRRPCKSTIAIWSPKAARA